MSYEYRNKRIIENFARRYTTNVSDEVDILFELEHVYSQAAKADEYEAKANAFDRIKGYNDRVFEGDLDSFDLSEAVGDVIEEYTIKRIIESGEPNAKK